MLPLAAIPIGDLLDAIEGGGMRPADLTFAAERLGREPMDSRIELALRTMARHPMAVVRAGAALGMIEAAPLFDDVLRVMAAEDSSPGVRMVAGENRS